MKFKSLFFFALFFAISLTSEAQYESWRVGSVSDTVVEPDFGVVLMGGASEHDEAMKWFLEKANGGDVVVIRTSGEDAYNDYFFEDLGVNLNSVETIRFENEQASIHPYVIEQLLNAEAIWIAGGDQSEYVEYWRGTSIEAAVNQLLNERGGAVGGTSAGMAVLCGSYYSALNGSLTSEEALANPFHEDLTLGANDFFDVPFMDYGITDTHYDDPDRKGRHVTMMARAYEIQEYPPFGIACDEFTAVTIEQSGITTVWGESPEFEDFVYFIRMDCETGGAETIEEDTPLHWDYDDQALNVLKFEADNQGSFWVDLTDWTNQNGGTWEYWWVEEGVLFERPGMEPDCSLNIDGFEQEFTTFYPNPIHNELEVLGMIEGKVEVFDSFGRLIFTSTMESKQMKINSSDWPAGFYIAKANGKAQTILKQ